MTMRKGASPVEETRTKKQPESYLAFLFRWAINLAVCLLALAAPAGAQTPWAKDCSGVAGITVGSVKWTPALCQEFNGPQGPPDVTAWSFDLGNGGFGNNEAETYCGPPGYANNPSQCPTSFSVSTANSYLDGKGHLVIQAINSGGSWYSARLKTQSLQNFVYGRIEASIQLPDTTNPGLWPAFWWLGSNVTTVPWPKCGEADIMENWSPSVFNGPGTTHNKASIHTAVTAGNGLGGTYTFPSGEQVNTAFYAYGVIWSANMLQFYVIPTATPQTSIQPFFIVTASDLPSGDTWPFNANAFLITNVAVGGTLGGSTANTPSPGRMTIDYIRAYAPSAVPAPGLGQAPGITVTAGATTGNTSTFTPDLAAGTGYAYFTCDTTAPKASCSINTDDPLNHFVVNSDAGTRESVSVAVATASNAEVPPVFFTRTPRRPFWLIAGLATLLAFIIFNLKRLGGPTFRHAMSLGAVVLGMALIIGCSLRYVGGGSGGNSGTTPGQYTVTVYAFTESNTTNGANANADANVAIPLTVN
jgi:beta-glucanase (GH16 family)